MVDQLKDLARERGLRDQVIVNRTSCLKHCSQGITVAVQPDNVWYARSPRTISRRSAASTSKAAAR